MRPRTLIRGNALWCDGLIRDACMLKWGHGLASVETPPPLDQETFEVDLQ